MELILLIQIHALHVVKWSKGTSELTAIPTLYRIYTRPKVVIDFN